MNEAVWVAEVWIDTDWYAKRSSGTDHPSAGMLFMHPLWEQSIEIGRSSVNTGSIPDIDCGADYGVSRRHARLNTDGQDWWAEDLQSSNGTFIRSGEAPLPEVPIPVGVPVQLARGDRIYLGAWTCVIVRELPTGR